MINENPSEMTETQKVYEPMSVLSERFGAAFTALQTALTNSDYAAMDTARIEIANIEREQREAAILMRQHLLKRMVQL